MGIGFAGSSLSVGPALFANGFTPLVSVIPPGAALSPYSKIPESQKGKVPGHRYPTGWGGYDWLTHSPTAHEVTQWDEAGANIGLRAACFPAVDIDCLDPVLADRIQRIAFETLGPAPVRVGRAPKRLLMYRTADPFPRLRITLECVHDGRRHLVEVLGEGQQYVVSGTHPSGVQYTWDQEITSLRPEQLTPITREDVARFLTAVEAALRGEYHVRASMGTPAGTATPVNQEQLRAPSLDALWEAVTLIPNDARFSDRADYIQMGYAIKAAAQDDPAEGFEIFLSWADRWEDGFNSPEVVQADWESLKPPFRLGWSWIAREAQKHGFPAAAYEFQALGGAASAVEPKAVPYSDQALADRFAEEHGAEVRYVPAERRWLVREGHVWREDVRNEAQARCQRTLRAAAAELRNRKSASSLSSAKKVAHVLTLASAHPSLVATPDDFDRDLWLLNTPDGPVDLHTGALRPRGGPALFRKSTAVAPAPIAAAPAWHAFLREATGGDPAYLGFLQRLAGYCLTGETKEHVFAFVHGPGGTGKSVFLNTIGRVLGTYATTAPMDTFTSRRFDSHPTELAMLAGARLVVASETEKGRAWHTTRLKSLTGGDPISARFMRQDHFTFTPQFKLMLAGNHAPSVDSVDDGIRRRLLLLPFEIKPAKIDHQLAAKLLAEAPGILRWAIDGALEYQRIGLNPPKRVLAATSDYLENQNALGRWLADRCEPADAEVWTATQDLYASWSDWCRENGEAAGSLTSFSSELKLAGLRYGQEGPERHRGYYGVRVRQRPADFGAVA